MNNSEIQALLEDKRFLREIIDHSPVYFTMNQFDDYDDPTTNRNIWASQATYDLLGYTREEIEMMGYEYFLKVMHPDDVAIIGNAISKFCTDNRQIFGGLVRLKPKNGDYIWFLGSIVVIETKNSVPWRFLAAALNMSDMKDTRDQIIELTRENLRLRNQLKIKSLTRREMEVIKLIANSHSDKSIAELLFISPTTAKTHRKNIKRKLDVNKTASIVQFAVANGLS